jgi:hypothetical protein
MPYRAVTIGKLGNYSRSGPGVSYPQTGRYDTNCTVGFDGYCVGEPMPDPTADGWMDSRWLRDGKGNFVSLAYLDPQSPDSNLPYLSDRVCPHESQLPGHAVMAADLRNQQAIRFDLRADHAANLGVALWVRDAGQIRSGVPLRQIGASATDAGGAGAAVWRTSRILADLKPGRTSDVSVVVAGTPCLGPNGPAATNDTATMEFVIDPANHIVLRSSKIDLSADMMGRLTRQACDSDGPTLTTDQTPAPVPSG